jgi:hypothetical protein
MAVAETVRQIRVRGKPAPECHQVGIAALQDVLGAFAMELTCRHDGAFEDFAQKQ